MKARMKSQLRGAGNPGSRSFPATRTAFTESHHAPANSASPISTGDGPALAMERADHYDTASWGNSREARAYRAEQSRLIEEGRFRDAQQMDIDDIRAKFGTKYDDAIQQMLDYTERQGY